MVTFLAPGPMALPQISLEVDPGQLLLAGLSLAVATMGSVTAAALLVYSPTKLTRRLDNGQRDAVIEELRKRDGEYQAIARILGVSAAIAGFLLMLEAVQGEPVAVSLFAVLTLFLCGMLPGAIAEPQAERIVLRVLPALRFLRGLLGYPLMLPLRITMRWILRALRIREHPPSDPEEIADEIMAAVTDSATENALADEERQWIGNIVELKDLRVSEAMTPRTDIVALEAGTSLSAAIQRAIETGHSRYPVYEEKVDNVLGVFYAKDALRLSQNGNQAGTDAPVRTLLREPLFVPETMGVVELLRKFKSSKVQIAIVLDEYGGTAGLISIEDIMEEIVGDISDEYDLEEEEPIKVVEEGRVLEISGRTRVDDVNHRLHTGMSENGDYDTIAGYVFSHLGRIPKVGETFQLDGVEFNVLRADDRRLGRLRVAALAGQSTDEES